MSKARQNFLYRQIQALLAKRLSAEEIEEMLAPVFDSIAIATIRMDDIFEQAWRLAMPMDEQGALTILNALESHLSQEDSLGLDVVNDQVQAWFDGMDWENIPKARIKKLQGSFLLCHFSQNSEKPLYKNLPDSNLGEAYTEARALVQGGQLYVEILSIDPDLDSGDLETLIACSNSLMVVEAL